MGDSVTFLWRNPWRVGQAVGNMIAGLRRRSAGSAAIPTGQSMISQAVENTIVGLRRRSAGSAAIPTGQSMISQAVENTIVGLRRRSAGSAAIPTGQSMIGKAAVRHGGGVRGPVMAQYSSLRWPGQVPDVRYRSNSARRAETTLGSAGLTGCATDSVGAWPAVTDAAGVGWGGVTRTIGVCLR